MRSFLSAFVVLSLLASLLQAGTVVEFKSDNYEVSELDHLVQITLTATPPPTNHIHVALKISGGTAEEILDYDSPNDGTDSYVLLPFGAPESSFNFYSKDDGLPEPDETVQITISEIFMEKNGFWVAAGAQPGTRTNATVLIRNAPATISVSDSTEGVSETNNFATVSVYRNGNTNQAITVEYRTEDDSARADVDFVAQSGTLAILAGERSSSFTIPILDNGRVDGDRELRVILSNPSPGANVLTGEGRLAIQDNEIPVAWDHTFQPDPSFSIGGPWMLQPDGKIIVTTASDRSNAPPWVEEWVLAWRLYRWNTNGSLDLSFRSPTLFGTISEIALDSEWNIYVAGPQNFSKTNGIATGVTRLTPNGTLDAGYISPSFSFQESGWGSGGRLTFQEDDKLLVADGGWLYRLNRDGAQDKSFARKSLPFGPRFPIATTPEGKILISAYREPTNHTTLLFRLDRNGELDPTFHAPSFTSTWSPFLNSLRVQKDGKIIVAGAFHSVDGMRRVYVARLNADGTVDPAFTSFRNTEFPNSGDSVGVTKLALDGNGHVLIGGWFGRVNRPPLHLLRLLPNGALDLSFPVDFQQIGLLRPVEEFANWNFDVLPDGNVIIAGEAVINVRNYDLQNSRSVLARLYGVFPTNSLEFAITELVNDGRARRDDYQTSPLQPLASTDYVVSESAGTTTITVRRIGDVSGSAIVRYATVDSTAINGHDYRAQSGLLTFAPLERAKSFSVRILDDEISEADETVVLNLSEAFNTSIIGSPSALLRIVDDDHPGSVDGTFIAPVRGDVASVWLQPDGHVLVAGYFSLSFGRGTQPRNVLRFRPDGFLDSTFKTPSKEASFQMMLRDGRFLARNGEFLQRFLPDGTLEPDFRVALPNAFAPYIADETPDGGLILIAFECAGDCTFPNTRWRLTRRHGDGSMDSRFHSQVFTNRPTLLRVLKDSSILVGVGSTANWPSSGSLIRLQPGGERDSSFIPPQLNGYYDFSAFVEQPDGRMIVAGGFTYLQGTNEFTGMIRLLPNGALDQTFVGDAGSHGGIYSLALQSDGKIIVGGDFTTFRGVPNAGLTRLNADGTPDPAFDVGEGFQNWMPSWSPGRVNSIAVLPNGQILAAGNFRHVNGLMQAHSGNLNLARINGDDRIVFTSIAAAPGSPALLSAAVRPARTYVLETSGAPRNWSALSTNISPGSAIELQDDSATGNPVRFYRLRRIVKPLLENTDR